MKHAAQIQQEFVDNKVFFPRVEDTVTSGDLSLTLIPEEDTKSHVAGSQSNKDMVNRVVYINMPIKEVADKFGIELGLCRCKMEPALDTGKSVALHHGNGTLPGGFRYWIANERAKDDIYHQFLENYTQFCWLKPKGKVASADHFVSVLKVILRSV